MDPRQLRGTLVREASAAAAMPRGLLHAPCSLAHTLHSASYALDYPRGVLRYMIRVYDKLQVR